MKNVSLAATNSSPEIVTESAFVVLMVSSRELLQVFELFEKGFFFNVLFGRVGM